ncbi:MAG: AraC family ligand binding domain-containing protein [Clostridiales bacterium]|nr:MAG: AraC family ligand binding domain-containing protein [Clostridiales bacterium]
MNTSYHERISRGTPEFPLELYEIDFTHPRYKMQMHWHKELEIIRVIYGTLNLKLNEREFSVTTGQSVFVPSGVMHSAEPEKLPLRVYCVFKIFCFITPVCAKAL